MKPNECGKFTIPPELSAALLAAADAAREERAERMPDDRAALRALHDAYTRLKEMGWQDVLYCPKDGSLFQVIEPGSTGIFEAYYHGEWPKGGWWLHDGGDTYPSRPILWRPLPPNPAK